MDLGGGSKKKLYFNVNHGAEKRNAVKVTPFFCQEDTLNLKANAYLKCSVVNPE